MTSLPVLLPKGYTPTVGVGDHVTMGQVLATSVITREEQIIDIAHLLSIPRRQARRILLKNPGDSLTPGEVVAAKKHLFGKEIRVVSDAYGTVKRYERDSGRLVVIRSDTADAPPEGEAGSEKAEPILSPVEGIVAQCEPDKIILTSEKNVLTALHGAGGTAQGELVVLSATSEHKDYEKQVQPHEIDANISGKIILGGVFSREDLVKCSSLNVLGIIGASIAKEDISYLLGKRLIVPLLQVDTAIWNKLIKDEGKTVFLDADNGTILVL